MIDMFFCTMDAKDAVRTGMSVLCQERWRQEKDVTFHRLTPSVIGCDPEDFQRERRIYADAAATSPIYICADDDCLLGQESPIAIMLQLMAKYLDFQLLSTIPRNAIIGRWTPEDYTPTITPEVWEHVSVGHIRFCRKGVVKTWPPLTRRGYDNEQCKQIRDEGHRSGYAKGVPHTHLGEGYSSVWR